jgi:glycosyltransferase involved in cell wall biosynthesis
VRSTASAARERRSSLAAILAAHDTDPFDLVHLQYKREQVLLTASLGDAMPVMWTEHGVLPRRAGAAVLRRVYGRAARDVAAIICVSPQVQADVARVVGSETFTTVIENGVDTSRFSPADPGVRNRLREKFFPGHEGAILSVIARLEPSKRVSLAVEAVRGSSAALLVAGDGSDAARLRDLARASRVRFTGHVDDVREVLGASDLVLFTTDGTGEGLPSLAMLESAAFGVPFAVMRGSGGEAVASEAGGFVVEPNPSAIRRLFSQLSDQTRGATARQWALTHDRAQWLDEHAALFRKAATRRL